MKSSPVANLHPIKLVGGTPVYEQVASYLVDRIRDGTFGVSDRLPTEAELAAQLEVGRSSVREALRVMTSRNFVTSTRGVKGGTFVVEPNADLLSASVEEYLQVLSDFRAVTVTQLIETRAALEVPAARLAAQRGSDTAIQHIRLLADDPLNLSDPAERFRLNRDFHVAVLEAAENRLLQSLARPVFGVLRSRFDRGIEIQGFWKEVDRDHLQISECIMDRDGAAAAAAMQEHLENLAGPYQIMDCAVHS
jgi:DNA-binding FadR family transcriptional regulator